VALLDRASPIGWPGERILLSGSREARREVGAPPRSWPQPPQAPSSASSGGEPRKPT